MDAESLSALIARGRSTIRESRSSRECTAATRRRNREIRQELHVFVSASEDQRVLCPPATDQAPPAPEPPWLHDLAYYRLAETAIDQHGRWARHVVLQRAIDQLMAGDPVGEQVWRRVFNAILALQHRLRQTLPSDA
jgi:hypothetical protein